MQRVRNSSGLRLSCVALVLVLALQGSAAAITPSASNETANDTIQATFTGHIPATMIDIDLPIDIDFEVDPNLDLETHGYNQVVEGSGNFEIGNRGGSVRLSIVGLGNTVDEVELVGGQDDAKAPFTYFGTMTEVTELISKPVASHGRLAGAMVSLWLTGETAALGSYLTPASGTDLEGKALTPAKFAGVNSIELGVVPPGETVTLQVYCYAKTNFSGRSFSFSLVPTIKVETVAARS